MRLWDSLLLVGVLVWTGCSGKDEPATGDDDDVVGDDDDDTTTPGDDDDDDTTSGDDDDDDDDLVTGFEDQVYSFDLAGGQWVQPAGVGDLLASLLGDTRILFSPLSFTETTMDAMLAVGSSTGQDLCSITNTLPPADWTDPSFLLYADELTLVVAGTALPVSAASLSGTFAPDGGIIGMAALSGSIDTRPLVDAFELGTGDSAVCDLVATFGVVCLACPDGSGDFCLDVEVTDLQGPLQPGATLIERTEQDVADDPSCQ